MGRFPASEAFYEGSLPKSSLTTPAITEYPPPRHHLGSVLCSNLGVAHPDKWPQCIVTSWCGSGVPGWMNIDYVAT